MIELVVKGDGPVFFVDDDEFYQMIISRVYEWSELSNPFVCFSSGQDCLAALEEILEKNLKIPALVLLDVNMPGMNGLETARRIRSHKEFAEIPVISMLSSSNDDDDIANALRAGASSYFEKPMNIKLMSFVAAQEET